MLELAVKYQSLIIEDDPDGDLYFGAAPPPSLLILSASVRGSHELLVHCGSLAKVSAVCAERAQAMGQAL